VPIADCQNGKHIGLMKKVRLSVKLRRPENFFNLIQEESKDIEMGVKAPPKSSTITTRSPGERGLQ